MRCFVAVIFAASFAVVAEGQRGTRGLPDYAEICNIVRNPILIRQYTDCALDKPDACNIVNDVNNIRHYLRSTLPSALGRARCATCDKTEQTRIAFFAKVFRQRYKKETSELLNHYRNDIAKNGGLRPTTADDLVGAPAGC